MVEDNNKKPYIDFFESLYTKCIELGRKLEDAVDDAYMDGHHETDSISEFEYDEDSDEEVNQMMEKSHYMLNKIRNGKGFDVVRKITIQMDSPNEIESK